LKGLVLNEQIVFQVNHNFTGPQTRLISLPLFVYPSSTYVFTSLRRGLTSKAEQQLETRKWKTMF